MMQGLGYHIKLEAELNDDLLIDHKRMLLILVPPGLLECRREICLKNREKSSYKKMFDIYVK